MTGGKEERTGGEEGRKVGNGSPIISSADPSIRLRLVTAQLFVFSSAGSATNGRPGLLMVTLIRSRHMGAVLRYQLVLF